MPGPLTALFGRQKETCGQNGHCNDCQGVVSERRRHVTVQQAVQASGGAATGTIKPGYLMKEALRKEVMGGRVKEGDYSECQSQQAATCEKSCEADFRPQEVIVNYGRRRLSH